MVNLQLTCGRRKLQWVLLYVILVCVFLAAIYLLIKYVGNSNDEYIYQSLRLLDDVSTNSLESDFYVAAVVEYEVLKGIDVSSSLQKNLQFTLDAIAECGRNLPMVDIVVFPEGTLYGFSSIPIMRQSAIFISTYVPSADAFIVPCDHEHYTESHLRKLSCAARENKIYVAVNVLEKVHSPKSLAWDGLIFHNTEVVFDRNGMVIARYRKFNLYTERWTNHIDSTDEPELVTFKTDFGVEFGVFTCFDMFFVEPALQLVQERNIKHFIFSAQLMNRLPFFSISSFLYDWSYTTDVFLLASTAPYPTNTFGTNIYFGRRTGTLTYYKPFQTSNIIVSPVPKDPAYSNLEYPNEYKSLQKYIPKKMKPSWFLLEHITNRMTTRKLVTNLNETSATFTYKSSTFECNITASWQQFIFVPNYRFAAYSGLNNSTLASINFYTEMCGITLCSQASLTYCIEPPLFSEAWRLIFQSIHISARSTVLDSSIRIPAAFNADLAALEGSNFDFSSNLENDSGRMVNHVNMILKRPSVNLLTFGILKLDTRANPATNFNHFDVMTNVDVVM
ncbi:vanin-like protein 1 [Planococcus citri]|uniref:vanin-like protein 1 n=1 Tax=Planococcus citri TaxID=170843 RepID=UPI0031F807E5